MRPAPASHDPVGASEAKTRFEDLLDRVARGETVVITRDGQPVARLVPAGEPLDRERARAAARRLSAFGEGSNIRLPKILSIEDLVGEGRD